MKTNKNSYLSGIIFFGLILFTFSCQKLDFTRVMDTSTDSLKILGTSVVVYGTILDVGEDQITSHGHCWATHEEPSISDSHTDNGQILGPVYFYSTLTSIRPGLKYYVRSYVYDGKQYTYGNAMEFEISAQDIEFETASYRKLSPTSIEVSSSAKGLGSINFDNHGHCWSRTDPPTVNDSVTSLGPINSDNLFTSQISNLTMGRYYIRAYLEAEGTVVYTSSTIYDSDIFIQTGSIGINLENDILANGNVVSLGVASIIDYGHCYSTTTSRPDFNSSRTSLGPLYFPLPFVSTISGITAGQTYYIRAYATDGIKVYYGEIKSIVAN